MLSINIKSMIIAVCCLVILITIVFTIIECTKQYNSLVVEETSDGTFVIADKADNNSTVVLYYAIENGESIYTKANIEDNTQMKIEIYPMEITTLTSSIVEYKYTKDDSLQIISLPDGDYTLQVSSSRNGNGSLKILKTDNKLN